MTTTIAVERVLGADEALAMWRDTPVPDLAPSPALASTFRLHPVTVTLDGVPVALIAGLDRQNVSILRRAVREYPTEGGVFRGAGIRSASQVFGNLARNYVLQRSSCRPCAAAETAPIAHATICRFGWTFAEMLREALPDQYAANVEAVKEVLPEWRLPGGLWTSGVVNQSAMLPYHRDRNNFDAWSVMPTLRRGIRGGHLHLPELEIDGHPFVVPCGDGDVLFFNGQRFMHGVTPMRRVMTDAYRFSAVYYPVKKMKSCLSAEAELARARKSRTESEATLVERQISQGILHPDGTQVANTDGAIHKSFTDSVFGDRFGR